MAGTKPEEDVDPRDLYACGSLVAAKQTSEFYDSIKNFFQQQAAFAGQDTYHFGNSTVRVREIPADQDFIKHNISIDFIAEQESLLERDIQKVHALFPTLQVYRGQSDALMALEMGRYHKKK